MKLSTEYEHYKRNLEGFLRDHPGEYAVIRGEHVLGFYATEADAFASMAKEALGTFMVKRCVPAEQDVAEFHSRVLFV